METPRFTSLSSRRSCPRIRIESSHEARIEKLNFNALLVLHNLILIAADGECILINGTVWQVANGKWIMQLSQASNPLAVAIADAAERAD